MHDDRDDKGTLSTPLPSGKENSARSTSLKTIMQIDSSLEAIRNRIDEAYNHICMDLPEINMEIYRTFQQASDTLDSLSAGESAGTIAHVVEGLEITLQNVMIRLKHSRNRDARFLETIRLTCLDTPLDPCLSPSDGISQSAERFMARRDELMELLREILEGEDDLMGEISSCITSDIRSLEFTLSAVVAILKDLISRSNSVKEPILKIMSGLQTHDIVNQDISTISLGLRKMYSLRSVAGGGLTAGSSFCFQERAAILSRTLISQLIAVVRHHGLDLEKEISRIESLIFHVKEDKDTISEFLLVSPGGESTFDLVISEVLQMFSRITAKVDALGVRKERQQILREELADLLERLDCHVSGSIPSPLPHDVSTLVHRMISPLKPQATTLRHVNGLQELKENSWTLHRDADLVHHSLEEIKHLLMGSIRGIDVYSGRCLDAIAKFKGDIQELMKTLGGSDTLLNDLDAIILSMADEPWDDAGMPAGTLPGDLSEILYRLENPHSSSLVIGEDQDTDEGLTFF